MDITHHSSRAQDHILPVTIGHYDPFEAYQGQFKEQLTKKINLTNLHWRKTTNDPLRSITELQVSLKEELPKQFDNTKTTIQSLDSLRSIHKKQWISVMNNAISTPLVRLMFVKCKDIDEYRSQVRPLVEVWLKDNIISSKCPLEWVIIFHSDAATDTKAQAKILEKLRTDFNYSTTNQKPSNVIASQTQLTLLSSDRVVHIKTMSSDSGKTNNIQEENETWSKLNSKLKASILGSFQARLQLIEDALDSEYPDIEGSNFNSESLITFIASKECVAHLYLNLRLLEDALSEYDSLERIIQGKYGDLLHAASSETESEGELRPFSEFVTSNSIFSDSLTEDSSKVSLFDVKAYITSKQFIILEGLATSASSAVSIQSIHISELLRRLSIFITEMPSLFSQEDKTLEKLEWCYILIDFTLSLESCQRIIKSIFDGAEKAQINEISENFGELVLLQRTLLLDMGKSKNYSVNDKQCGEVEAVSEINNQLNINYEPLRKSLKTHETFNSLYVELTEQAIKYLNLSNRPRAVDALSIDIALLDFHNKNYTKAVTVLSSCPGFYCSQGWDYIGFNLLTALIECLENIDEQDGFFKGKDALNKDSTLAKYYLDYITLNWMNEEDDTNDSYLHEVIVKLFALKDVKDVSFNVNSLFKIDCECALVVGMNDTFQLHLDWLNELMDVELELQDVKLVLKRENGDGTMVFFTERATLQNGENKVSVQTDSIVLEETYIFDKITAKLNNISITYELDDNKKIIFPQMSSNASRFSIDRSTILSTSQKSISIFIQTSSESPISDVSVQFLEDSKKNIRFLEREVSILPENPSHSIESNDTIKLSEPIPKNTTTEIRIPYEVVNSTKANVLSLSSIIKYRVNGQSKSQQIFATEFQTALPIAVSVQDIFKSQSLYAKFTIGSVNASADPVSLVDVTLDGNEKFEVTKPFNFSSTNVVSLKDQLCLYFFKIQTRDPQVKIYTDEFLKLDVIFRELKDEMMFLFKDELTKKLQEFELEKYLPYLNFKDIQFDNEKYSTHRRISVINHDSIRHESTVAINIQDRLKLLSVFKQLATPTAPLSITKTQQSQSQSQFNRHLSINVQIPIIEVIHEISLRLINSANNDDSWKPQHSQIGTEMKATMQITSHIHKIHPVPLTKEETEKKSKRRVLFQDEKEDELTKSLNQGKSYHVELSNNQDTWIINGLNKFMIEIQDMDQVEESSYSVEHPSVELSIIPLKTGKLALPKVKVSRLDSSISKNGAKDTGFQVDYKEENEFVYVLSGCTGKDLE
ncbi:hypothetical protein WICPIJ_010000 [Wickerhamomyces pijperi]|uniref:Trafficking protein particle complex subunit 11 domain-containing protein n=1 Tax=Wickerhamomyces pijperi TaxID=599730 RepID=A0A9P8TBQ2_WICPI|nr:hypothetical protein WICPIJ_010000 [Wickerhamomyces pijperi]